MVWAKAGAAVAEKAATAARAMILCFSMVCSFLHEHLWNITVITAAQRVNKYILASLEVL
jgi:hypothetical protein